MTERWFLTGGTGQVGMALLRNPPAGVTIHAPNRDLLDLSQTSLALPSLEGVSAIVNCAAYTAVDRAESEADLAQQINARVPAHLAAAAAQANIPIVHISTDYVFPTDGAGPWREDAPTAPGNVYGESKLAGEEAVRNSGARHAIVRTAWVISVDGSNFVKTMLRLGSSNDKIRVVADQRGTPTHAGDLAAAIGTIAKSFVADTSQQSDIWHCSNAGETTWHGLALHTFACAAARGLKVPREIEAITTADYPTPARRPADSRLDCGKLAKDFGISLRPWQEAVDEIVAQLAREGQVT